MAQTTQPPSPAGLARGLLFVHLLLSPLVFTRDTLELFEYPKVALLRLTALALTGLGLVSVADLVRRRRLNQLGAYCREPVTLGILLFTASAALSTVVSLSPRTSLDGTHESFAGLATIAAYAVLFLATRTVCRSAADCWRLLTAAAIAAAVTAGYGLVQVARLDPLRWSDESIIGDYVRPLATLGHPNHVATYLTMAVPFVAIGAIRAASQGRRGPAVALGGVGLLALAGIALTLSRAGWLAVGAVILLLLIGLWCCGHRRVALAGVGFLAIGSAVGAAAFAGAGTDLRAALVQRVRTFGNSSGRTLLWRTGWDMALERPFTGVGLDAFALAFGQHRPMAFWRLEWNVTPTKAHNDAVQVLATQGFPGAAAALLVVVGLGFAFRRAWHRTTDDSRHLALATVCAIVGFLIAGFFGFTVAATGSVFVICAGILVRLAEAKSQISNPKTQSVHIPFGIWGLGLGICLVVAWLGVIQPFRADVCAGRAVRLRAIDPTRALALNEEAIALHPGRATLWAELGETARVVLPQTTDPRVRQHLARRVQEATAEAARLVPEAAVYHSRRGELLLELAGDGLADPAAAALSEFDAALARDPQNPRLMASAARAAWVCGRTDVANGYLNRGLALDPTESSLYATLGSMAAAEGRFEEAEARLTTSFRLAWHGYEEGHLQALTLWCYCMTQLHRINDIEIVLQAVIARRPDWPGPHLLLGEMLAAQNRPGAVEEFQRVIALAPEHPFAHEARRRLMSAKER
jgi:O-antigen ligase